MSQEIITFGCRLNIYESEVIKEALQKSQTENVIVFNTCAVTKEAERQAMQAIRKARRNNPDKKIIVTGCAAQINPQKYSAMNEVDQVLGNQEKLQYQNYLPVDQERVKVNDIMSITDTAVHLVSSFEGKTRAFIEIQNGCNHRCTFCTIPYGRGNSRSVPIGAIVEQVKLLVSQNFKEIVLTGVDITDYGLDLPGKPTLGQMIKRVLNLVPHLLRLRLSSIDVAEIDEELMNLILNEPRLMPHIHISVQSGDNMILKRMKRRHNRDEVIAFCQKVRAQRKDVAFGADIIAGFPTETEEMFNNTLNLISEAGIQYTHIFTYSEREDTPAARMPQVDLHVRKERAKLLRKAGQKELNQFIKQNIGKTHQVIIEQNNYGHTENFLKLHFNQDLIPGSVVTAKITSYENKTLNAILVS
jgi:threonylcarbamoyladenosine tRNA methylthiotransferase MtaB